MTLTDCDFISVMRRLANTDCTDKVLRLKDSGNSGDSWSKKNKEFVVTWDEHKLHGFNERNLMMNVTQLRILSYEVG